MSTSTSDVAIRNLERLIGRDPLLRDLVHPVLPHVKRNARFSPDVDVIETEDAWLVILEVPGVPRQALQVDLDGSKLVVRGEKPARAPGRTPVAERSTGPFERTFLVPFQVDPTAIRARLELGQLTITLPRTGAAGKRSVPIEGAGGNQD